MLRIAWDGDAERVLIEASSEPAEDDDELTGDVLSVRITGAMARAFVARAESVVAAGRPPCPFCTLPLDPEGHICPRANGYRGDDGHARRPGHGELEIVGQLVDASNGSLLCRLRSPSPCAGTTADDAPLVIYKPRAGERPLWDFPDGTLSQREVAAFVVAETLGWQIVPPTVWRDGPFGPGMVQLWVDVDTERRPRRPRAERPCRPAADRRLRRADQQR